MINYILLQATSDKGMGTQMLLIAAIILVFYFFMIRPQQKKGKKQKKFFEHIKKGDEVITIGGIHGKVYSMQDDQLTLEIDSKGAKVVFETSAISLELTKKYSKKV